MMRRHILESEDDLQRLTVELLAGLRQATPTTRKFCIATLQQLRRSVVEEAIRRQRERREEVR